MPLYWGVVIFGVSKMKEYPKALYIGDKEKYQQVIADDAEHEAELRNTGHVDHLYLPNAEPEVKEKELISTALDSSELEQKLADVVEQLAFTQGKYIEFKNNVSAMQAQIQELENGEAKPADYNDLTSDQLRELLTEQGKTYKVRDSKPELIALLVG